MPLCRNMSMDFATVSPDMNNEGATSLHCRSNWRNLSPLSGLRELWPSPLPDELRSKALTAGDAGERWCCGATRLLVSIVRPLPGSVRFSDLLLVNMAPSSWPASLSDLSWKDL